MEFIANIDNRNHKIEISERLFNFENLVGFFKNVIKEGSNASNYIEQTEPNNYVSMNNKEPSDNHERNISVQYSRQSRNNNVPMKPIMVINPLKPEDEEYYPDKSIYDGSKDVIFFYVPEKKYEKCLKNGCLFTHPPVFYKKLYHMPKYIDPTDIETNNFHPIHNNHNRMFEFSNLKDFWKNK